MKKKTFAQIGIGRDKPTFIIAEAGINHNGDLKTAFRLVDAAKKAGASAIKFQTYITEKRVPKGSPIYSILKQCELTWEDTRKLKQYADKKGIMFFSTPFDQESVAFLAALGVPLLKVASFDIVNLSLLRAMIKTKIPMIISRGMASAAEVDTAARMCKKGGVEFALLHCVSAYPAPKKAVNLRAITTLAERFDVPVGFSDHTLDIDACVYAVVRGATVLEKHFTLDRKMKGPDHQLSADPKMLATLVSRVREAEDMLGSGTLVSLPAEADIRQYRRVST